MPIPHFLPRALTIRIDGSERLIHHTDLLALSANLIILGEAGMGKSRLLEELQHERVRLVTAQRLINHPDPAKLVDGVDCLLVDALDEAAAFKEGEAVNGALAKIEQSGVGRFILSCRSEDWQAATMVSLIRETFGAAPLELQLKPFDDDQISGFLTGELGSEGAAAVFADYRRLGFSEWLGNPQTLIMLAEVVRAGQSPKTTGELFSGYVELNLPEGNQARRERAAEVSMDARLDVLGAAFAALILSGKAALAKAAAAPNDDDLRLSELEPLPGNTDWNLVSGNRLVRAYPGDPNRLIYAHRRIGEWLAARWLARQAKSDQARERLLAALTVLHVVPASLRGLFAWLAQYRAFSLPVIKTDPMAVVEYGDADALRDDEAEALFGALEELAKADPYFAGWGEFRAKALVRGHMRERSIDAVLDQNRNDRLRLLLASQLKGEQLPEDIVSQLRAAVLNEKDHFYALRQELSEAVIENVGAEEIRVLVEELRRQATHDSTRLASHLMLEAGLDLFDDEQVVQTIMADCGNGLCAIPQEGEDRMSAKTWRYRRDVPDARLISFLDCFANYADALLPEYRSIESTDVIGLGDALIARQLMVGPVDPERLIRWLEAFGGRDSYVASDEKTIADFLRETDEVRRAIQFHKLGHIKTSEEFFEASYKMANAKHDLAFTDSDLAAFLDKQDASFPWEAAVRSIRHSETEGAETRAAARRFAGSDNEYHALLESLLNPGKRPWEVEQEKKRSERASEREVRWASFREGVAKEREQVEQARYGVIQQVANVYFARYSDLESLEGAEARLIALCGEDMLPSIRIGLETYLGIVPLEPSAADAAASYAENRMWSARYILLAGLAERFRTTGALGDLTRDQLVAAQLHCANFALQSDEWSDLRRAIWDRIVSDKGAFEEYARLMVEPSFAKVSEFTTGLFEILQEGRAAHPDLVDSLVAEWLHRFPDMHFRPEAELMDVLLRKGDWAILAPLIERRLAMKELNEERLHNWQAAALITNFEIMAPALATVAASQPGLFWAVRSRMGARRPYDGAPEAMSLELTGWLIEHFRKRFPLVHRPSGVTMGESNPWDATEAISRMIDRLGTDLSGRGTDLLEALASVDDGYRDRVLAVLAENRRQRAEQARSTLSVQALADILTSGPPHNLRDLQVRVVQLMDRAEAQIKNNPTDTWVTFFRDDKKTPHGEEQCRDRIIEILQQHEDQIEFSPEKHLGNDREGDIASVIAGLHLPIEVKGQWHSDLWRAADDQLLAQQAADHQAGGYGILLVLWFGGRGKALTGPPQGSGISKPTTPLELEEALTRCSKAARDGNVVVKVIDLSRD